MTVANISWSISTKECYRHRRGSNPRLPSLQSDAHPTEPPRPAYLHRVCQFHRSITKSPLYSFDPLKPHFYTVKLGFTGVNINFLISVQKHRLWVPVRTASPRRFLQVPTINVLSRYMITSRFFSSESFHFVVVKFSIYLNMRVFVMHCLTAIVHITDILGENSSYDRSITRVLYNKRRFLLRMLGKNQQTISWNQFRSFLKK